MLTIRLNFKVFTDLSIKMDEFSFSSVLPLFQILDIK